ncbi:MAG: hypothetical protein HY815_25015, partial [Candidatus Riflebacteria bacterium]|nr:hypothetical protein [Candidatus Riflebacteria bacterium]
VLHVTDLTLGREVSAMRMPDVELTALAFSPDGTKLLSGHRDGTCLIWAVRRP